MTLDHWLAQAIRYLQRLCLEIPNRRVGSQGNWQATHFFSQAVASFGFQTTCPEFDCIDWTQDGACLSAGGKEFEVWVSPYSLGCHVSAPLCVASTLEELEAVEAANQILLMRGGIAKEQLMPKNFPFYKPDKHQRIIHLLEVKGPRAIIAATSRNPEMAGAVYPFPLIEDGDFDIPSVYMTEEVGESLTQHAGQEIALDIRAERIPARGCNVIARRGGLAGRRVVLFAHIDSKDGTPGALDNAAGVAVLILLAELLHDYNGHLGVELVALNGEDYYSNPGEIHYLQSNQGKLSEILLGVNLDGVGYYQGRTTYSLYACPHELASSIRKVFAAHRDVVEGEPWYQSDHMLFVQSQIPALAITSERVVEILTSVAHTARDRPELVDCSKLAHAALALRELLLDLDEIGS